MAGGVRGSGAPRDGAVEDEAREGGALEAVVLGGGARGDAARGDAAGTSSTRVDLSGRGGVAETSCFFDGGSSAVPASRRPRQETRRGNVVAAENESATTALPERPGVAEGPVVSSELR